MAFVSRKDGYKSWEHEEYMALGAMGTTNHAIVGYRGRRYTAIYNLFVDAYFVDDVDGEVD
jgi:hypothetical protein